MRRFSCLLLVYLASLSLNAQDYNNFTQFFINQYTLNPSYAGIEGRPAVFFGYRRQWANIENGPSIAYLSLHAPLKKNVNFGLNIGNDKRGVITTSSAHFTVGYTLLIDNVTFIRFGVSAGGSWDGVNVTDLGDVSTDPALASVLDNHATLLGNAGISFHFKSFHAGVSMPYVFEPAYVSEDAFTIAEVKPFQALVIHASNRFYFADDKHVFEPYLVYRINDGLPSQYEAAVVLHLNHVLWLGGSYKQDFGISALGGAKLNNLFLIGGSFSLKNTGINELNSPSYEIHVGLLLGNPVKLRRKKDKAPHYSFVNTVKEKERIHKPTASQILAEKRKQEELERKKQEELARKQAEEARLQQEDQARLQREAEERARLQSQVAAKDSAQAHDGGPRLKHESGMATVEPHADSAQHHDERERISRIELHADDPDVHHADDPNTHPHAERHEFVKKGSHQDELEVGDYIIAGVFRSKENAQHFSEGLVKLGFNGDYGHLTEKNLWYVYISHTDNINEARTQRDNFRKMAIFRDAWLLTVHH
jgi:type IX secretion system PorP/SprF family membrane protein